MSIAKRVKDARYIKGMGPEDLADKAQISRTALYQIESGRTAYPRANTLKRIALALEIPIESLLGQPSCPAKDEPKEKGVQEMVDYLLDTPLAGNLTEIITSLYRTQRRE